MPFNYLIFSEDRNILLRESGDLCYLCGRRAVCVFLDQGDWEVSGSVDLHQFRAELQTDKKDESCFLFC